MPPAFSASRAGVTPKASGDPSSGTLAKKYALSTFPASLDMPDLNRSCVTLRIIGDDLIPDEITQLLDATPTHSQTLGERFVRPKTGRERIAQCGMWRLCATDREPEDINSQIDEIFAQMTTDLETWRTVTTRYRTDLFCGFFMEKATDGFSLSPKSLLAAGSRGIKIAFDIYAGEDSEENKNG